jgi:hypothetical protein
MEAPNVGEKKVADVGLVLGHLIADRIYPIGHN